MESSPNISNWLVEGLSGESKEDGVRSWPAESATGPRVAFLKSHRQSQDSCGKRCEPPARKHYGNQLVDRSKATGKRGNRKARQQKSKAANGHPAVVEFLLAQADTNINCVYEPTKLAHNHAGRYGYQALIDLYMGCPRSIVHTDKRPRRPTMLYSIRLAYHPQKM
jgi:hypothetical protein